MNIDNNILPPLFELGEITATRKVAVKMQEDSNFNNLVIACIDRYIRGNFGTLTKEDIEANISELKAGVLETGGGRILARYHTNGEPDSNKELLQEDIYIQTMREGKTLYTIIMYCNEY